MFRPSVESLARLYDMQHETAYRDVLTYRSPSSGQPVGASFLIPRTRDDLAHRRQMIKTWADATCGMMGRSADFLNTMVTAWAAKSAYFAQQHPECEERVLHWRNNGCVVTSFTRSLPNHTSRLSRNPAMNSAPVRMAIS